MVHPLLWPWSNVQNTESEKNINFTCDTKWRIREIAISNVCNTHIVQILREKNDGRFIFRGYFLSGLTNPVEISHEWVLTNFKYQEPKFYSRLFNESEKVTFESPPGCTKKDLKNKYLMLLSCMFSRGGRVIVCSVHCRVHFTLLEINFWR